MGVLKLFTAIAAQLAQNPAEATTRPLDELAGHFANFSYIGNRKGLESLVREEAVHFKQRSDSIGEKEIARIGLSDPALANLIRALRQQNDLSQFIQTWFGKDWLKDSGVFPDFLLGLDNEPTFGNGALLELKDSKEASIASFNSTIPTRYKSLEDVKKITGSIFVPFAAKLYDFQFSQTPDYLQQMRSCFYLIRTRAKTGTQVRVSLVEGSFFETLPKHKLLQAVWGQILDAVGITGIERDRTIELLGELEQGEIAQSREIEGASVRPRLRLMAEVHPEGNIHRYTEILPRTLNLVIKNEPPMDMNWLIQEFQREKIAAQLQRTDNKELVRVKIGNQVLVFHVLTINHKRNGEHLVLQMKLDS